jgi:cytochrome c biogenesis protein CcdA
VSTELPIPLLGAMLGLIDGGFNPCALSVLFFLIAYLMALGSRKKCLLIGLTYSSMVFVVYFLFMYGVLNVISIIGYLEIIKTIVGILIIVAGAIELKDFFWYGKGVSLEIPKFAKSPIEKLTKAATIPSAILLGVLVSFVEIPCAGAFPLIYLTILARTSGVMNVLYLLWYNFFFVLPLVVLVIVFYFGLLKVEEAEEKRIKFRKYMRLVAGLIMLSLGSAMLLKVI